MRWYINFTLKMEAAFSSETFYRTTSLHCVAARKIKTWI